MKEEEKKPKLVFFQWNHEGLPKFQRLHMQLHVKCLSEFFEVILINKNCDYKQICDTYQPDLTLFESGFRTKISRKINIKNTSASPEIPKLGLHNGDSWCDCRVGFISDMEHWGIETFFSICTTTAEHTPEIANNLFVWPNFIDSDIYRDYHQAKEVPILSIGLIHPLYPWRQKIYETVSSRYSLLTLPHLGYKSNASTMIYGEQYARAINNSWFVPTCGTIAKEVVRKHFEIPGSKSCLITEKTQSVEAAGFVDMQNCVFANEKDVLDKLDYLFKNTDKLNEIINAGYELVQSRHTLKQRDQIYQWFNLHRNLKSTEKIIQLNPFKPFGIVEQSSGMTNKPIVCNGLHLELLHRGDEKLLEGKYDEAEALYLKCLHYMDWMREPKLKLAICNLHKGNADAAFHWIIEPVMNNLKIYNAADPDPIEWTYLIVSLLCKGKLNEAIIRSNQFPSLQHSELSRIRWAINHLQNKEDKIYTAPCNVAKQRYTVHQLPQQSLQEWITNLCVMLKACQQIRYAEILSKVNSSKEVTAAEKFSEKKIAPIRLVKKYLILIRISCVEKFSAAFKVSYVQNPKPGLPPLSVIDYFMQLSGNAKIELVKRLMLSSFWRLNTRLKPFLPFVLKKPSLQN
jgi:hypothetical protein